VRIVLLRQNVNGERNCVDTDEASLPRVHEKLVGHAAQETTAAAYRKHDRLAAFRDCDTRPHLEREMPDHRSTRIARHYRDEIAARDVRQVACWIVDIGVKVAFAIDSAEARGNPGRIRRRRMTDGQVIGCGRRTRDLIDVVGVKGYLRAAKMRQHEERRLGLGDADSDGDDRADKIVE